MSTGPSVLGQLRSARWITLTVVALASMAAFAVLSHWQWERAHRDEATTTTTAARPFGEVVRPGTDLAAPGYGSPVLASGNLVAGTARLLPREGRWWVVAALDTGAGVVPVVVGSVAERALPALPDTAFTAAGPVQPYEGDPGQQGGAAPPADEIVLITRSALESAWSTPVAGGWIAGTTVEPSLGLAPVTAAYDTTRSGGLRWQNATYALQWIGFAAFVVFLWVRWFRDELRPADSTAGADSPTRT